MFQRQSHPVAVVVVLHHHLHPRLLRLHHPRHRHLLLQHQQQRLRPPVCHFKILSQVRCRSFGRLIHHPSLVASLEPRLPAVVVAPQRPLVVLQVLQAVLVPHHLVL